MPQSISHVYVPILVFSTKYRQPLIDDSIKNELYNYMGGICKHYECYPVQIGGLLRPYSHSLHAFAENSLDEADGVCQEEFIKVDQNEGVGLCRFLLAERLCCLFGQYL